MRTEAVLCPTVALRVIRVVHAHMQVRMRVPSLGAPPLIISSAHTHGGTHSNAGSLTHPVITSKNMHARTRRHLVESQRGGRGRGEGASQKEWAAPGCGLRFIPFPCSRARSRSRFCLARAPVFAPALPPARFLPILRAHSRPLPPPYSRCS